MIQSLTEIAPLSSWAILVLSTLCFVGGFVAYGHARLARKGLGEPLDGPAGSGPVPTMARWMVALLAAGVMLWGVLLGWPVLLLVILGAVAAVPLAIEGAVRLLG